MPSFTNIAAYQFAELTEIKALKQELLGLCKGWELKGTILLSEEGINLFVAGSAESIDLLLARLRRIPGLESLPVKVSLSDDQPFSRMLVKLKKEIIAFGVSGIQPGRYTSKKLPPAQLKQWLDEGKPITLLDTRNDYEIKLGTFKNAKTLDIDHFRHFPAAVEKLPAEMKQQPIVMFCTGGIRCEKAGPFMEREGFTNIFQLEGGILKYFEDCGDAHYDGTCFVFDQRVGVDPALRETDVALCFACLMPLKPEDQADARYVPPHSCPYCFKSNEEAQADKVARRMKKLKQVSTPPPGSKPHLNTRPLRIAEKHDGLPLLDVLCDVFKEVPKENWLDAFALKQMLGPDKLPTLPGHKVSAGERYYRLFPEYQEPDVNTDIRILHEDDGFVVVNKPAPLPMHASGRYHRNTLEHLLNLVYAPEKLRPAHRLDANTTGVVVFSRSRRWARLIQPQFELGQVEKTYLARIHGVPTEDHFSCNKQISDEAGWAGIRFADQDGVSAFTEFKVLNRFADGTTLLEVKPHTGRTHQIRLHLWHLGYSIVGDPTYLANRVVGQKQTVDTDAPPMCLHASMLSFLHPLNQERILFSSPDPEWIFGTERLSQDTRPGPLP
ncbi:MAG TPA: pseudouridine synthase [Gemmatales bacterium]|nr:pseudouridine synthase [Gemmatales bacterium]